MVPIQRVVMFLPQPGETRRALDNSLLLCRSLLPAGQDDLLGNIRIVLAEALNNVMEHAFAGLTPTQASLEVRLDGGWLTLVIRDRGHPMPGGAVPAPHHHDLNGETGDLPEGGFGWMLIHELTSGLEYRRIGNENRLCLKFRVPGTSDSSAVSPSTSPRRKT